MSQIGVAAPTVTRRGRNAMSAQPVTPPIEFATRWAARAGRAWRLISETAPR